MKKTETPISVLSLEELVAEMEQSLPDVPHEGITRPDTRTRYGREQYIRFVIEDIILAVPLSSALEIGHRPRIMPLPNLPEWVMGVTNLRGEIISIVSLNAFFGISPPVLKPNQRFIVIHHADVKTGILVDRISGIFTHAPDEIEPGITLYRNAGSRTPEWAEYVSGIVPLENEMLNILDVERLLSSPRMDGFRSK